MSKLPSTNEEADYQRVQQMRKNITRLTVQNAEDARIFELYEQALKASWPEGAMGDAFDYWNQARIARGALAKVKEAK